MKTFTRKGEWSEVTLHQAKTGWVMEQESRIQGTRDGLKKLLPYSDQFPQDMDLEANWNEHMSNGERVIAEARAIGRMLRHGGIVR